VKKKVFYEQPLNDRVRNLLRLEFLFEGITYRLKGPSVWESRDVVGNLIEVLDFLTRVDLKNDLISDLEHHYQALQRWQQLPKADIERMNHLLNRTHNILTALAQMDSPAVENLIQHPLLSAVRQRHGIPGGASGSDVPVYHFWLQKTPKQRQGEVNDWLMLLEPLRDGVELDLFMIRNNVINSQETASKGFFQSKLDAQADYQLIRVGLPAEPIFYPEINGGKHRFTIRFFEQAQRNDRPFATEQDVNFELCCCMI
jgi:cell division protein ZapD